MGSIMPATANDDNEECCKVNRDRSSIRVDPPSVPDFRDYPPPMNSSADANAKSTRRTSDLFVLDGGTSYETRPTATQGDPKDTRSGSTRGKCVLQTKPSHGRVEARFVLFQRDSGMQLASWIRHYLNLVGGECYDCFVVIDHLGEDPMTAVLLDRLGRLGVHVWRCDGAWSGKGRMWSQVVNVYQNHSEFIFPLDVDEWIILMNRPEVDDGASNITKRDSIRIKVDASEFIETLQHLDTINPDGKPYKMEKTNVVPIDCSVTVAAGRSSGNSDLSVIPTSNVLCDAKFLRLRAYEPQNVCLDKTFTRGSDFVSTDTGNHVGFTREFSKWKLFECHQGKKPLEELYISNTGLGLLHVQVLQFSSVLLHALRGAYDYGFSQRGCNCTALGEKLSTGKHYCPEYAGLFHHNENGEVDYYAMRRYYQQHYCPNSTKMLSRIDDVVRHSCAEQGVF